MPKLEIEAMDQPTGLYIIYSMVVAQQTNVSASDSLSFLKCHQFLLGGPSDIYGTSSQCFISYGCAIIRLYVNLHVCSILDNTHQLLPGVLFLLMFVDSNISAG